MNKNLTAKATISIAAAKDKVWEALITPSAIKEYMFGSDVETDWKKGSKIIWKGEFKGKKYEDKGEILNIESEKTLQYSHFSPLSGKPDKPENYHTVTINLSGDGNKTEVELSQDNNATEKEKEHSTENWKAVLKKLKEVVESEKINMLHTTPFLLFDGNCAEAMTFYHKCLGGELTLTKLGDTPMKDMLPKEKWDRIINAQLKSGEIDISATDWMASPEFDPVQGNTFAIYVTGKTYDELKPVFDKLKDGDNNERLQELHDVPFGTFGQFYDKYGVQWIFRGEKVKSEI